MSVNSSPAAINAKLLTQVLRLCAIDGGNAVIVSVPPVQKARTFVEVKGAAPTPVGHQVVIDVKACGLCHSDVHQHDGYFNIGGGAKVDATRIVNPPRTRLGNFSRR